MKNFSKVLQVTVATSCVIPLSMLLLLPPSMNRFDRLKHFRSAVRIDAVKLFTGYLIPATFYGDVHNWRSSSKISCSAFCTHVVAEQLSRFLFGLVLSFFCARLRLISDPAGTRNNNCINDVRQFLEALPQVVVFM